MTSYKYRCAVCTCLFASAEVKPFFCARCNEILAGMGRYDAKQVMGYVCKVCTRKFKNSKKLEEVLKPVLQEHMDDEHGSVNLV